MTNQLVKLTQPQSPETDGSDVRSSLDNGVLIEVCSCGNRMRVPSSWTGRRKTCRRCGAELILGSGVESQESGVAVQRQTEIDEQLRSLIDGLIQEVESQSDQSALTSKASTRVLKRLEQRLQVTDPSSRDDAIKRRAAVLELGKTGDGRAVELLKQALHDPWEPVRQGIASAAGELGDPAALPLALTLLMDADPEVVRDSLIALKEIGDPRVVPILLLFGQQDPALRLQVRETLVGIGEPVVSSLIAEVQSTKAQVADAVVVLGRIGDARAVAPLLNALDRLDRSLHPSIVEALGRIGDERAIGPLIKLLDTASEELQMSVASALTRCPDTRSVRPLMGVLLNTQNIELQKRVARALAATRDPRCVVAISKLIDSTDDGLREVAAEALGAIGDPAACSVLVRLLKSDNSGLVLKAISAMRRLATEDAVPALIPLVQHPNPSIRRHTVEILGDLHPGDAFDLFAELLADDVSFEVRAAAAKGLGKLKDKHAIRLLEQALRDEPTVRCAAVMGLTAIGEKSVIPALLATLKDATPVVRYHAVTGLGKLKAEQAIGAIQRLLEDKDSMVRTGAKKALNELGIEKPAVSRSRQLALAVAALTPSTLAGSLPGGLLSLAAVPCILILAGVFWFVRSNSGGASTDIEIARAMNLAAEVTGVGWIPKDRLAATFRSDGVVDLWEPETGKFVRREIADGKAAVAHTTALSPSEFVFFRARNRATEIAVWSQPAKPGSLSRVTWNRIEHRANNVTASADGIIVAIETVQGTTVIWNTATNEEVAQLPFNSAPLPALSGDGTVIAGVEWKPRGPQFPKEGVFVIRAYSTQSGEPLFELDTQSDSFKVSEVTLSESGDLLAIQTRDGIATLQIADARASTQEVPAPDAYIKAPRLRGMRFISHEKVIGTKGTNVYSVDLSARKVESVEFHKLQSMKIVDGSIAAPGPGMSEVLVAASEHKSGWLVDLANQKSVELSPLDVPIEVRDSK